MERSIENYDEEAKEKCLEVYKEEKRKVKRFLYNSKKDVQEQFGKKMNQDVNGNRKCFWKELSKRMVERRRIPAE